MKRLARKDVSKGNFIHVRRIYSANVLALAASAVSHLLGALMRMERMFRVEAAIFTVATR
jgi:hypothetical protein